MNNTKWSHDTPKVCGYYLACWKWMGDGRSRRVSEFWFDGADWWTGREYIHAPYQDALCSTYEQRECITDWVIAWMPKPKYTRQHDS